LVLGTGAISRASALGGDTNKAIDAAVSIFEILDSKSKIDYSNEEGVTIANVRGDIDFQNVRFKYRGIPRVPLKKIVMLCESLEKFSGLQRHCYNFFMPSMPLPSVWAQTPSNCRCEKSKNTLMSKYVINFFEHLNDFK